MLRLADKTANVCKKIFSLGSLFIRLSGLRLTSLFILSCIVASPALANRTAYINGAIYTVDPYRSWADTLVIENDRIVFVGFREQATAYLAESDSIVDLEGKFVLPGLIDAHSHVAGEVYAGNSFDIDVEATKEEVLENLADFARNHDDYPVIIGRGFSYNAWGGKPAAADIDRVVADRPVILQEQSGHGVVVNSLLMELAGITKDTKDPNPGAAFYSRDASGQPSGWMTEEAIDPVWVVVDELLGFGNGDIAAPQVYRDVVAAGYTSVYEAWVGAESIELYAQLDRRGELPFRVFGAHGIAVEKIPNFLSDPSPAKSRALSRLVSVAGIKFLQDGAPSSGTAAMCGNSVPTTVDNATMQEILEQAERHDIDAHVHTVGNCAVKSVLDSLEAARKATKTANSRVTLAHADWVDVTDMERMRMLGVFAAVTPIWIGLPYGDLINLGPRENEVRQQIYPFGAMLRKGVTLTFSTDFPVVPGFKENNSPFAGIEFAMTRRLLGNTTMKPKMAGDQRVTLEQAITAFTTAAARQFRAEGDIGSLEVGKKADFIVMNQNLFDIPAHTIHKVRVLKTVVDGEVVFSQ